VVAGEVKRLAETTGQCTLEIDSSTAQMHAEVERVNESMKEIGGIIGEIRSLQEGVARAVRDQAATSKYMSERVNETASKCRGSNQQLGVLGMAKQLEGMAEELDRVCRSSGSGR
jgi:methyl-accepting chemotaxis protein